MLQKISGGLLVACVTVLGACAPPARGAAGTPLPLYVSSGIAQTVTQIAAETGRPIAPPVDAGVAPNQVVVGPGGTMLVQSISAAHAGALTFISPTAGTTAGTWVTRNIPLGENVAEAQLAGGGEYAVAAYWFRKLRAGEDPPLCRLALINLRTGELQSDRTVCAPRETVRGLTLHLTDAGPIAYVSLWAPAGPKDGQWLAASGRVVALDPISGAVLDALPTPHVPGQLVLAPGPGRSATRLYVVEGQLDSGAYYESSPEANRWLLRALDPLTLAPIADLNVSWGLRALAVSRDGNHAYALAGTETVLHVDLRSGLVSILARLPEVGLGLALTERRLYVANPAGDNLWVIDRQRGYRREQVRVAEHPISVTWGTT